MDLYPTGAVGLCDACTAFDAWLAAFVRACPFDAARVTDYAHWLVTVADSELAMQILDLELRLSMHGGKYLFGYVSKVYFGYHDERTRE